MCKIKLLLNMSFGMSLILLQNRGVFLNRKDEQRIPRSDESYLRKCTVNIFVLPSGGWRSFPMLHLLELTLRLEAQVWKQDHNDELKSQGIYMHTTVHFNQVSVMAVSMQYKKKSNGWGIKWFTLLKKYVVSIRWEFWDSQKRFIII